MFCNRQNAVALISIASLLMGPVDAYLSGSVGPLTKAQIKKDYKTCNVLDYGAVADNTTDVGQPITDAFADCGSGGMIYIPEGDYSLQSWVTLTDGTTWGIQMDGVLWRGSSPASQAYMISIEGGSDFELFSSTSAGAIQGSGYLYHMTGNFIGPRMLAVTGVTHWSVHDLLLVDSPMFHFVITGATNGEVYNLGIRGADHGGLDGIDVTGTNIWIHDVMVTNKDECVTTKNLAQNILIENIYCNISGGCAMGSLGSDVEVSDITYRNVYTWSSNQMFMIKSNGGSGDVSNLVFDSFMGHGNAYSLDFDSFWASMNPIEGDGIYYHNITFSNWSGTQLNGEVRPPIKVVCPPDVPCTEVYVDNVNLWVEQGGYMEYLCENAYGGGYCVSDGSATATYTTTSYVNTAPAGYSATTLPDDLTAGFGTTALIPIPTLPASFFPGVAPISAFSGA